MRKTIIACGLAVLTIGAYAIETDGLVLALNFDQGRDPVDISENPANVAINGQLNTVPSQFGQGLEFDGDNANVVEVDHADKLVGMDEVTITAWFKTRDVAAQEGMSILSKRVAHQNGDAYNLFIWTGRHLYARVNSAGEIISTAVVEDDAWYHVAYVFDGDGGGEAAKLYIDGALDVMGAHAGTVNSDPSPVWIGELDANRGFAWNGVLDEITMWNRALTEDEIGDLMVTGVAAALAVEPRGKLATTWAKWKRD